MNAGRRSRPGRPVAPLLLIWLLVAVPVLAAGTVDLVAPRNRDSRWVAVERTQGPVEFVAAGQPERPASLGDRLRRVGDRLHTGPGAWARVSFDDGIGRLTMDEQTELRVLQIRRERDGASRTRLRFEGGAVRLSLRQFVHPGSRFEVETPAGVAVVRGTSFGLTANRQGVTAVATAQGRVSVSAQGQSVQVDAGQLSLVIPGKPPQPPRALALEPRLYDIRFDPLDAGRVRVLARTDPGNLVRVAQQEVQVGLDGRFSAEATLTRERLIPVQVTTPLAAARIFRLTVLLP